jgi:class 3 adenylate cyclase/CheY-like chemotaxis protein
MGARATILVVDDVPENVRLLEAVLAPRGYEVVTAGSGKEALEMVASDPPSLVLLDLVMPGMDGHEVCRRLRAEPSSQFLPVVMVTASGEQEKVRALETGADDFVTKPFDQAELLARVRSLLRIHEYRAKIEVQAAELERWNQTLEERVSEQVGELERVSRLKRFLSPQVSEVILSNPELLESHRREITVVFSDLRGFTPFAESAEPEDVHAVLRDYHAELGALIFEHDGTLERFTGDGMMIFFNDPLPCPDAPRTAVEMAVAMRAKVGELKGKWERLGHDLDFGMGVAQGYATLGGIGFEGRGDYAAIGTVTNLAARLCAEADGGEILVSDRVYAAVEGEFEARPRDGLTLKGFSKPVRAHSIIGAVPQEAV